MVERGKRPAILWYLWNACQLEIDSNRKFIRWRGFCHRSTAHFSGWGAAAHPSGLTANSSLSAALLLEHLGLAKSAAAVRGAVAGYLKSNRPKPPDLGGPAKTAEVTQGVLAAL